MKYGGLGLVDSKEAKTSLFCEWIVRAMDPEESNLQLMLRYRLIRFNPQRGWSWGVRFDWFTCKQYQGLPGSKVWGHISKTWKNMVKGMYQILSRTMMKLLHSNLWWSDGETYLNKILPIFKG